MNTHSARQHWFVLLNGERHGPLTFATLLKAARSGVITAETSIWRSGWQKWHPARQVPGLLNETPLAPEVVLDDTAWTDEQPHSVGEQALLEAPQLRDIRPPSLYHDSPRDRLHRQDRLPQEDPTTYIFAEEWRMLAEQPAQHRDDSRGLSRFGRKKKSRVIDLEDMRGDVEDHRSALRTGLGRDAPSTGRFRRFFKRIALGLCTGLLLWGGWHVFGPGSLQRSTAPKPLKSALATPGSAEVASAEGLPTSVANLPAVVALQRNDPASFERFKRRFMDSAANAQDDELMSLARAAMRKSVKQLLAISSGDVLLEITEISLAYMQGLQASNPESCVALSDESKGARLTGNLAKEFPIQFVRDMSVLERVAGTNPHATIAPLTAGQARPYLETVFNRLRQQSVKSELLGRDKLDSSEFKPYCALVIAFYQSVLDLPRDDKVNLLRYLYAAATVNADSDLAR